MHVCNHPKQKCQCSRPFYYCTIFYDMKQVRNTSQDVCCRRLVQAMFPIVFNSARSRHSIWCTHQGVPFNTIFVNHYCIGTERYQMLGGRFFLDTSRLRWCSGCLIDFSFVGLKNNRQNVCANFSSTKCSFKNLESLFVCCSQNSQKQNFCCKELPQNAKQLLKCWRETSLSCCSFLLVSHSSFTKAILGTYRMLNLLCKKQLEHACLQNGILLSEPSLSTHLDAFLLIYLAIYTLGILLQVE